MRVAVVPKAGPRGGHTVAGEVKAKQQSLKDMMR